MNVIAIENAPPMLTNVLLWDAMEREWRVGHGRIMVPGLSEVYWVDGTVDDAHDLITDGEPVGVFTQVTHWARLPDAPG